MRILKHAVLPALLFCCSAVYAQNVTIRAVLKNMAPGKITLYRPSQSYLKDWVTDFPVTRNAFTARLTVDQPEIAYVVCQDTASRELFKQYIFLQKGYDLHMVFGKKEDTLTLITTGKGAADNQKLAIAISRNYDQLMDPAKDTLPSALYTRIMQQYRKDSLELDRYTRQHKPSPGFANAWKYQMKYQVPYDYVTFSSSYKFAIQNAYQRHLAAWQGIQEQLFTAAPLSDEKAMVAPVYILLLGDYAYRIPAKMKEEYSRNRTAFLYEWYGNDTAAGKKKFREDPDNRPQQKMTDRYFSGKAKEYMYAMLFVNALHFSQIINLEAIFSDFKRSFPQSRYIARFQPQFTALAQRTKRPLSDKIIFVKDGDKINKWENVLAMMKGKTVLLDIWGTWCIPCRDDIKTNTADIKKHFDGKGLDYLYVANHDSGNDSKWKELINYFNLEGYHIMANENLSRDILKAIKGTGYPSYAIIHRDGKVEFSKTSYPMKKEILISQLEDALK